MDLPPPAPVCRACGAALTARGEGEGQLCLGCLLEPALMDDAKATLAATPGEVAGPGAPATSPLEGSFAHYQIDVGPDGFPVELGCGAMGVTYRARDTILRCPVALKVISLDLSAHPRARARFLREARAAAGLRHPHVASVFFFGQRPEDAQPFYAMELVEGETLHARVRRCGGLAVATVLEIGRQVADALGAAEARGLLHRDLKPANLMLVAGEATNVKVIDFGLARAAAEADASALDAGLTGSGEFIGTPSFASPEQFDDDDDNVARSPAVDARSDFYALGATLWYALTGQVPFAGRSLAEIHERQLHRPLPLGQLRAARVPRAVVDLLRSLLSADPAGRPQTATELAAALAGCREQVAGRFGRAPHTGLPWTRRELAVALGVVLLGVGLLAGLSCRTGDVARQNRALQQQALAQQQALVAVQVQLQQQTQLISLVNAKIERSVSSAGGGGASGRSDPTVAAQGEVAWERGISVEALQRQLEGERADVRQLLVQIEQRSADARVQDEQWQRLKAEALTRLGDGEFAAGHYPAAVEPYQEALALAEPDKEPLAWCDAAGKLELTLRRLARFAEAAPLIQRLVDRRIAQQGPEHPATLKALHNQAQLFFAQDKLAESEALFHRVLEAQERTLGKEHSDTLKTVNNLSALLHFRGKDAEAETLGRRCVEACERTLGKDHPDTLNSVITLAATLYYEGNFAESAALNRRCLEARERLLGPDHPDTIRSVNNLAVVHQFEGDLAGAEALFRRALAAQERTLGPDHPMTITILHNLGDLLQDEGDYAASESFYRRALEGRERVLGPDHPDTLSTLSNLAQLLDVKGEPTAAEPLYQQAQARVERLLSPQDAIRLDLEHFFSLFREKQGRLTEALALAKEAGDGCKLMPESSPLRRTYEQHSQELQAKVATMPPPGPVHVTAAQ